PRRSPTVDAAPPLSIPSPREYAAHREAPSPLPPVSLVPSAMTHPTHRPPPFAPRALPLLAPAPLPRARGFPSAAQTQIRSAASRPPASPAVPPRLRAFGSHPQYVREAG